MGSIFCLTFLSAKNHNVKITERKFKRKYWLFNKDLLFRESFRRFAFSFVSVIFSTVVFCQNPNFDYTFSNPFQVEGRVFLKWAITAGSTCSGIQIERSTDSLDFVEIGSIVGQCGDANFDVPYNFTDENPGDNSMNYYRLRFGVQAISKVKKLFVINVKGDGFRLIPNPVTGLANLFFENKQQQPFQFILYDLGGNEIQKNTIITTGSISITRNGHPAGLYVFRLLLENEKGIVGKIQFQ